MAAASSEMAIFQRVAERGSFAGAAQDVGLSPSAVAKLITRLEGRLGARLINRTTRHLALTAEGETYLERTREILAAIESAEADIGSARLSPRGPARARVAFHCGPSSRTGVARLFDALPSSYPRFYGHQPNRRRRRRKSGHFVAHGRSE